MTKRISHDFSKTDKLNQLRVDYRNARLEAQTAPTDAEKADWNTIADGIFQQVHNEGFNVYGPAVVEAEPMAIAA